MSESSSASGYSFEYPDLPILARRDDILKALSEAPAIVVQGGTGSGKTTQLPKFLLAAGYAEKGLIGVTQPRRIAALSITDRLRQETGRPELIGAKIRFHEDVPREARVKVMTDGVLLQEFRRDPYLRRYACVILDEAHERSLNVDILLGIFKGLLSRRRDFRLVVTSATLDAARFAEFLGSAEKPAPVVEVEGRQYPVAIEYWDPAAGSGEDDDDATPARVFPPVEAAAMAIRDLQKRAPDNLLAFLPTEKEINELHRELEGDLGKRFAILPLYSRLGPSDQKKVFQDSPKPKIILATNIAETSLTIPGIGYVVDTGLARVSRYHPQTKIQGLPIERVSQASARQRAGRAGRVKPGTCVRLYAEEDFNERAPFGEPEILRSNLANVVLQLLALGLDVGNFPFPDPPSPAALKGSFRQLHELGAVDSPEMEGALTEEGLRLSRLPVDVALGKILLKAEELKVLEGAMVIAAGLTISDTRFTPHEEPEKGKAVGLHRRFDDPRSDFLGLLGLWIWIHRNWDSLSQRRLRRLCQDNFLSYNRVREWIDLTEQFARLLKVTSDVTALRLEAVDPDALHKAILAGFLPFMAQRRREDVSYRLAGDKEAFIHPGSSLGKRKPEWIVAGEVRQTSRTFIFRAAEIKPAWVEELAPEMCKKSYTAATWNPERGFVEAMERVTFKSFVIRADRRVNYESVAPEECAEIFWREGVVLSGSGAPFPFRDRNEAARRTLAALERKARVRGLVPDEDSLVHWYRARAPEVTSRIRLQRFLEGSQSRDGGSLGAAAAASGRAVPGAPASAASAAVTPGAVTPGAVTGAGSLEFTPEDWAGNLAGDWDLWLPAAASGRALERLFPDALEAGGLRHPLSYRFDHGDPLDGISLELPLAALPALTVTHLLRGIPGWRKWIWDWALERLPAKARQAALAGTAELAAAWMASTAGSPCGTLAAALATVEGAALSLPATWPAYLQIHVVIVSPSGRRSLIHVDPSFGDAELFAAAARLAFGAEARPWDAWAPSTLREHGALPPPLPWRGDVLAADPFASENAPGFGFFSGVEEAEFRASVAARAAAARRDGAGKSAAPPATALGSAAATAKPAPPATTSATTVGLSAATAKPAPPATNLGPSAATAKQPPPATTPGPSAAPRKPSPSATPSAFFTRRLDALLDAWGCPQDFRQETSRLRKLACDVILPSLFADPAEAEKELPPCRAVAAKPGAQVKSLSALGQAVGRGGDGAWAGAYLSIAAALVSRGVFLRWYRFFAQPPAQSRDALARLFGSLPEAKSWRDALASPFHAAWLAQSLAARIPDSGHPEDAPQARAEDSVVGVLPPLSAEDALRRFEESRQAAEARRKAFKTVREGLTARFAALGSGVAGLPQDLRAALETLDKPASLSDKLRAELELTLHVNRLEGRAGVARAPGAPASTPKGAPAAQELRGRLMKDLSGRFKKL